MMRIVTTAPGPIFIYIPHHSRILTTTAIRAVMVEKRGIEPRSETFTSVLTPRRNLSIPKIGNFLSDPLEVCQPVCKLEG